MKTLRRYFEVYKQYWVQQLALAASFRLNFSLMILFDIMYYAVSLLTIDIIFLYSGHIGSWDRNQFMFFAAFMMALDNIHMAMISQGFWIFATNIRLGGLDHYLVKPVHPLFSCFVQHFRPTLLISAIIPWSALYYFAQKCELSLLSMAMLPLLLMLGLVLLVCIEIAISMLNFVTIEGAGINFFRMQLQAVGRWPNFIYGSLTRRVFTFILPVLIVGSFPVTFLFDNTRLDVLGGIALAVGGAFVVMVKAWQWGIRRYQSASS